LLNLFILLLSFGLKKGTEVVVKQHGVKKSTIKILALSSTLALRFDEAKQILVKS